jgi:hypothetical protein
MTSTSKVKVTLLIDQQTYEDFRRNTAKYPRGVASFLFQRTLENVNLECEATGRSSQLDLFKHM